MDCPLQTVHLCLLKRILGVEHTTPNWSVLRERGFKPLQFYWLRSAVRFCNASLTCNSITLRKVLAADVGMTRRGIGVCGQLRIRLSMHGHPNKLAKYHNWVALPFRHNSAFGKPLHIPRYLYLGLGRHTQRNIACFRWHAHKLKAGTSLWQGYVWLTGTGS
eukprot:1147215-Pelagomonas_calceolata.AAC.1